MGLGDGRWERGRDGQREGGRKGGREVNVAINKQTGLSRHSPKAPSQQIPPSEVESSLKHFFSGLLEEDTWTEREERR